jgi:hypothetical protein
MYEFNDMITDLDLHEIQLFDRSFTWSNKRPNLLFFKLDRVLLSNHWDSLTSHISYLTDLPTLTSDHASLILKFRILDNHAYRSFSFKRHWLQYEEARDKTRCAWDSIPPSNNPVVNLVTKFKKVKTSIKPWASKKFNGYNKLIQKTKYIIQILDGAEEVRMLSGPELNLKIKLKEHTYHLANIQEMKWRQRSATLWLKKGDANFKKFHTLASASRTQNHISHVTVQLTQRSTDYNYTYSSNPF